MHSINGSSIDILTAVVVVDHGHSCNMTRELPPAVHRDCLRACCCCC